MNIDNRELEEDVTIITVDVRNGFILEFRPRDHAPGMYLPESVYSRLRPWCAFRDRSSGALLGFLSKGRVASMSASRCAITTLTLETQIPPRACPKIIAELRGEELIPHDELMAKGEAHLNEHFDNVVSLHGGYKESMILMAGIGGNVLPSVIGRREAKRILGKFLDERTEHRALEIGLSVGMFNHYCTTYANTVVLDIERMPEKLHLQCDDFFVRHHPGEEHPCYFIRGPMVFFPTAKCCSDPNCEGWPMEPGFIYFSYADFPEMLPDFMALVANLLCRKLDLAYRVKETMVACHREVIASASKYPFLEFIGCDIQGYKRAVKRVRAKMACVIKTNTDVAQSLSSCDRSCWPLCMRPTERHPKNEKRVPIRFFLAALYPSEVAIGLWNELFMSDVTSQSERDGLLKELEWNLRSDNVGKTYGCERMYKEGLCAAAIMTESGEIEDIVSARTRCANSLYCRLPPDASKKVIRSPLDYAQSAHEHFHSRREIKQ